MVPWAREIGRRGLAVASITSSSGGWSSRGGTAALECLGTGLMGRGRGRGRGLQVLLLVQGGM
jgi:hypothetical protein